MQLRHLSLCSGIGGIDLAAEWAGFETVGQCEIDEYASRVLAKNFKGVPNLHDIRTVTNARLRECGIEPETITVLSAGFPCQPYSLAGKGKGDGDERDLWDEVARCIGEIKPRWFVGENTPGLFARSGQRYFKRILTDLAALGYTVSWGIWGACDVGAPHRRDRVFLLGRNTDNLHDKAEQKIFTRQNADSCGIDRAISDTDGLRKLQSERRIENIRERIGYICKNVSDAYGEATRRLSVGAATSQPVFGIDSGIARAEWWQIEPDVGRVAHGIPARVDRLRCLGNAVVPQQVYPIFKAIAELELFNIGFSYLNSSYLY